MSAAMVRDHAGTVVSSGTGDVMHFTAEQRGMIRDTFACGASEGEFAVLLEVASARRLNPLLRQIHFVKRYDSQKRREVWSTQVSIDGLRAIAQRTGLYAGQDEPEFIEERGQIVCCKVRVFRRDWMRASVGVAYWSEYVQTTREGAPTRFWQQMPHVMISKCAEAIALRKAFPEDMSGLYVPEEREHSDRAAPVIFEKRDSIEEAVFIALSERVDAAETPAELNAIAKDCMRARREGRIGDAHIDTIAAGVKAKRAVLGAPPPPQSEPTASEPEPPPPAADAEW